ncbi:MAG: DUF3303 family protein [Armatimonadota bacterium]|nr:DUF3303 family protein [Armatimonadota bacterium]MDR7450994.1 DUF3303 family protein [Armatimonadota bacterium]MDR7465985.1 DUF3303 family protein [Armatimonadota bacterium]MDR7494050.1 DUF3303 family protein [Armatimonadota bacterium]MDR7504083.1 DUF3303 family protein [Armatimonadota bacterium]
MLVIAFGKAKAGTVQERLARRAQWQYPPGLRVVAEYWPQGGDYNVIVIAEADSAVSLLAATAPWSDLYDFTIAPVITAEEGLRVAPQFMKAA